MNWEPEYHHCLMLSIGCEALGNVKIITHEFTHVAICDV